MSVPRSGRPRLGSAGPAGPAHARMRAVVDGPMHLLGCKSDLQASPGRLLRTVLAERRFPGRRSLRQGWHRASSWSGTDRAPGRIPRAVADQDDGRPILDIPRDSGRRTFHDGFNGAGDDAATEEACLARRCRRDRSVVLCRRDPTQVETQHGETKTSESPRLPLTPGGTDPISKVHMLAAPLERAGNHRSARHVRPRR